MVTTRTNASSARELYEAIRLRVGKTKLGRSEYYLYNLNNHSQFSFEDKKKFIGWRVSRVIDKELNDDRWRVFANDKIVFYSMMAANGMSHPITVAVYNERGRFVGGVRNLNSIESVEEFFKDPSIYPIFVKPINGTYGRGAFSAICYDSATNSVLLGSGKKRTLDRIALQFRESWTLGYIFQEILEPHPETLRLIGNRLSSLRIVVILAAYGPKLYRGIWKFPVGKNMSDNFGHGETGNLIASINLEEGTIDCPVTISGNRVRMVERHPDTNSKISGLRVPMWHQVKSLCSNGALLFPELRMQHWDIAVCRDEPIALEVNVEGSVDLHQIAGRTGFYDKDLEQLVAI